MCDWFRIGAGGSITIILDMSVTDEESAQVQHGLCMYNRYSNMYFKKVASFCCNPASMHWRLNLHAHVWTVASSLLTQSTQGRVANC